MINARAFAVLLSSLAAFVFLSPEPAIHRVGNEIILVGAVSPAQSVKKATEEVVHTTAGHAKRTGETVRHVGSAAYEKLAGAGEAVENAAHQSKDKAKGGVLHASDKVSDKLGDAAYATGDAAYATGDWLKDSKHEEHQHHTEEPGKLQRATEMLKERLQEAMQYQPNLGEGVGYYTDGYGIASSRKDGEGYIEEAKNAAKHGYGYVSKETEKGIGRGKETLDHGKEAAEHGKDEAALKVQHGKKAVDHGKNEAASKLEQVVNAAKNVLKHRVGRGKETLHHGKEGVDHAKEEAASKLHHGMEAVDYGKDEAASKLEEVVNAATNVLKHGYGTVNEEAEQVVGRGKETLHQGREAVDYGKDEAASKLEEVVNAAKGYLNQAAEHTMNSGKDAYQAVSHGKDELASTAESYVEEAKDAAREGFEYVNQEAEHTAHRGRESLHRAGEAVKHAAGDVASALHEVKEAAKHGAGHVNRDVHHTVHRGKEALHHSKDVVVEGSKKGVDKVHEFGSNARGKVDETLRQAGRWAHGKMVKLNETEEMALAVCKQWIQKSVTSVVRLLHLFVFSSVYGSALWVTFISGFALARSITKHQFGVVQSKIFPVYFRVLGSGILLLLATHTILHPFPSAVVSEMLQYYNLAGCLAFTLLNAFLLEPQATKSMFEKLRLEKEEGRGVDAGHVPVLNEHTRTQMELANRKLNKLHTLSSAANLLVLVGLTWHLWYLNCRLVI